MALAQDDPAAKQASDNHTRFYETIVRGSDQELILDNLVRDITAQMITSDPNYIALEQLDPGLGSDLVEAIKPAIRAYRERAMAQYAPRLIGVAQEMFTAEEAGQLADFYASAVGRRLMQVVSGNVAVGQRIDPAIDGKPVTARAIASDDAATLRNTMADLSPADVAEIAAFVTSNPAAARLGEFSQRTLPIRTEMENEPPNAEELAQIERLVDRFMATRLGRK
jgi:hypothetical protein